MKEEEKALVGGLSALSLFLVGRLLIDPNVPAFPLPLSKLRASSIMQGSVSVLMFALSRGGFRTGFVLASLPMVATTAITDIQEAT